MDCETELDSEYVFASGAAHCSVVSPLGIAEAREQWQAQLPSMSCATSVFAPKQLAVASQSEHPSTGSVRFPATGPNVDVVYDVSTVDCTELHCTLNTFAVESIVTTREFALKYAGDPDP